MTHWNRLFWLLFVLMGLLVITASFMRVLFLELMLGFLVIAMGLLKMSEELASREIVTRHGSINESIRYLTHQIDSNSMLTNRLKERHEHRLLHLDTKRADIEKSIEEKYDSLAKKLIQQENKLNDAAKAIVEVAKRHESFAKDASKDLKNLEKLRQRTSEISVKMRRLQERQEKALKTM